MLPRIENYRKTISSVQDEKMGNNNFHLGITTRVLAAREFNGKLYDSSRRSSFLTGTAVPNSVVIVKKRDGSFSSSGNESLDDKDYGSIRNRKTSSVEKMLDSIRERARSFSNSTSGSSKKNNHQSISDIDHDKIVDSNKKSQALEKMKDSLRRSRSQSNASASEIVKKFNNPNDKDKEMIRATRRMSNNSEMEGIRRPTVELIQNAIQNALQKNDLFNMNNPNATKDKNSPSNDLLNYRKHSFNSRKSNSSRVSFGAKDHREESRQSSTSSSGNKEKDSRNSETQTTFDLKLYRIQKSLEKRSNSLSN